MAVLGGQAGKFESESGANTNLESQRPLAAGRANLKAKAVQTRIWNQGGPWRPGGQICKRKRCKHKFGITAAFGGRAGNLKRMQLIGFRVVSGGPGGRIKNTVFAWINNSKLPFAVGRRAYWTHIVCIEWHLAQLQHDYVLVATKVLISFGFVDITLDKVATFTHWEYCCNFGVCGACLLWGGYDVAKRLSAWSTLSLGNWIVLAVSNWNCCVGPAEHILESLSFIISVLAFWFVVASRGTISTERVAIDQFAVMHKPGWSCQ